MTRLLRILIFPLVLTLAGCAPAPLPLELDLEDSNSPKAASGTPEELVATIHGLDTKITRAIRKTDQRNSINELQQVADELLAKKDATEDQENLALRAKLGALFHGAKKDPREFRNRFLLYAEDVTEKYSDTPFAFSAESLSLELQCLSGDVPPPEEAIPQLLKFAKKYPKSLAPLKILARYGQRLEDEGRVDDAVLAYRTAVRYYVRSKSITPVSRRLRALEREKIMAMEFKKPDNPMGFRPSFQIIPASRGAGKSSSSSSSYVSSYGAKNCTVRRG